MPHTQMHLTKGKKKEKEEMERANTQFVLH